MQLYRAAGLWGVPTLYQHRAPVEASRDTSIARQPGTEPFLTPRLRLHMLEHEPGADASFRLARWETARRGTQRFRRAGLTVALGTDMTAFPDAIHRELAELVSIGLTPAEALVTATSAAARVLGLDGEWGEIAVGRIADLVLLDADPWLTFTTRGASGV